MRKVGSLRYQGGSWGLGLLPEMLWDLISPTVKHGLSEAVAMHQKELWPDHLEAIWGSKGKGLAQAGKVAARSPLNGRCRYTNPSLCFCVHLWSSLSLFLTNIFSLWYFKTKFIIAKPLNHEYQLYISYFSLLGLDARSKQLKGGKVCFGSQFEGIQSATAGKAKWQEHAAADHTFYL